MLTCTTTLISTTYRDSMIKRVLFLVAFFGFNISINAQLRQETCVNAISSMQFQQLRRNVSAQIQPMQRFNAALKIMQSTCLNTSQLLDLLSFFSEDGERLELAISAYPRIVNQQDIYDVYNAFAYFSSAFRYHDYVQQQSVINPNAPVVQSVSSIPVQINFPQLNYPDVYAYQGVRYCASPLSEADFMIYLRDVAKNSDESSRMEGLRQMQTSMCLSTAQCMKMTTLLMIENNRLEFLKKAYSSVYDEGNFEQATQVFGHVPNQITLRNYILSTRSTIGQPVPRPCELTMTVFNNMHSTFAKESSSSSRKQIVKDQLPRYNCYTSSQIKQVVSLFSSSSDKLEVGKFAFDYVSDPDNYFFELSSLFSSSMDRQSLSNYVSSKHQK